MPILANVLCLLGQVRRVITDGAKNMIAASFTALPSWVTNSDDVAELPIEDQESGIVEMEIELEESENVSFPILEVIDISNEDL